MPNAASTTTAAWRRSSKRHGSTVRPRYQKGPRALGKPSTLAGLFASALADGCAYCLAVKGRGASNPSIYGTFRFCICCKNRRPGYGPPIANCRFKCRVKLSPVSTPNGHCYADCGDCQHGYQCAQGDGVTCLRQLREDALPSRFGACGNGI